jgi:hypothetical protein
MENLLGLENKTAYTMDSNLTRRIRNFTLSADQYMMPLFEAVSNSIHAIQEKFQKRWVEKGRIQVEFIRRNEKISKILITDNGIGLNDYNFDSFLKNDSEYKTAKGGKGVGRFTWLKSFNDIKITSAFMRGDRLLLRTFNFGISDTPVYNHVLAEYDGPQATVIELSGLKSEFASKYDVTSLDVIAKHTISHFMLTMVSGVPDILFIEGDKEINIREVWDRSVVDKKPEIVNEILGIKINHIMLKPGIVDKNTLHLSANYRSIQPRDIGNLLGLKHALIFRKDEDSDPEVCYYVGVLSGDLFDRASYGERTGLSIPKEMLDNIMEDTIDLLKNGYLKQFYDKVLQTKTKTLQDIIEENPKFAYLVDNPEEYVKTLNTSSTSKTEVYKELAAKDYDESSKISSELQDTIEKANKGEKVEINEIAGKATRMNMSALAEYIKKRKEVLDLLDTRRGWVDPVTKKNYLESDMHSVICPMRLDSDNISINEHNLWVLDDRLAYYGYFASDKQIRTYIEDSTSEHKPDIALFKGCNAFERKNTSQPVVIIEFKRPERDDYTDEENPIKQVLGYIDDFKNRKVRKSGGQVVTTISDKTPFQCYIVCDITPKMLEFMKLYGGFAEYPDGHGFRSYREEYKAMIDIISFENLVNDAKLRNEIFFDKLEILDK